MIEKIPSQHQRYVLAVIAVVLLSVLVGISVTVVTGIVGMGPQAFLVLMLSVVLWLALLRYFEFALAFLMIGFPFYILLFNVLGINTSSASTFLFYFFTSTAAFIGAARQNSTHLSLVIKKPATLFLALFMVWMGLNWAFLSPGIQEGRDKLIFGVLLMILPYLTSSLYTIENLRRFMLSVIGIGTVLLILSITAYISGAGFVNSRFTLAENISPLALAYFLGAAAVLSFIYAVQQRRVAVTLLVGIGLAGVVFVTILTSSRGPVLALALSVLATVFLSRSGQRFQTVIIFTLFAVVVSSLLPLVPSLGRYQNLLPVMASLQETGEVDVQSLDIASAGRVTIWQVSLSDWRNNSLTGVGLGNTGSVGFAHNFLLETLVEVGLIGFVFLSLFLITTIINLVRSGSIDFKDRTLYFATLALLVYSLTQASFSGRIQTSTMLWVASGMVNALILFQSSNLITAHQEN